MINPPDNKSTLQQLIWTGIPAIVALGAAIWLYWPAKPEVKAPPRDPHERRLETSKESLYNNIYVYSEGDYRSMTFGYNKRIYVESSYNSKDELELPVTYTRYMTAALIYPKQVSSVLEIGFGGGRTMWYLHKSLPQTSITSVELDPEVVNLSRQYFGIKEEPNFNVVNNDGRRFLAEEKEKYDVILIDAYRGPFVPFHLLTKEFYEIVKAHLNEGGVVAQNIEPSTMLFDSAVMTLKSVFPNLDFYSSDGNVVTVAYDGAALSDDDLGKKAAERQHVMKLRYSLSEMALRRKPYEASMVDGSAKVLTDDFAPVETLKAIDAHNRKWIEK